MHSSDAIVDNHARCVYRQRKWSVVVVALCNTDRRSVLSRWRTATVSTNGAHWLVKHRGQDPFGEQYYFTYVPCVYRCVIVYNIYIIVIRVYVCNTRVCWRASDISPKTYHDERRGTAATAGITGTRTSITETARQTCVENNKKNTHTKRDGRTRGMMVNRR